VLRIDSHTHQAIIGISTNSIVRPIGLFRLDWYSQSR